MRYPIIILLLFTCIIYSCCTQSTGKVKIVNSTPININLDGKNAYLPIQKVIDTFWYVFLEQNDSTRSVGRVDKLLLIDKKLYVLDVLMASVSVYDLQGKYLYDIGSLGLGKGQFRRVADIAFNPVHNTIYLLCNSPNKTVYEFSLSGTLIKQIHLFNGATGIAVSNRNTLFFFLNRGETENGEFYDFAITDSNSVVKDMLFKSPAYIERRMGITGGIYACNDSAYANPPFQNTFYLFTDSSVGARKYYIDFGKDSIHHEFTSNQDLDTSLKKFSFLGKSLVLGPDFIGFNIIEKGGYFKQVFYNKNTGHIAKADTTDPVNSIFNFDIYQSHDTLFTANYVRSLTFLMEKRGESIKKNVPGLYEDVIKHRRTNQPVIMFYKLKSF